MSLRGVICLSDLHLRVDSPEGRLDFAPDTQRKKMDYIFRFARENKYGILQAGDFFNKDRSWYIASEWAEFFMKYSDVPIYVVYGQHDTHMYNTETRHATNLGLMIRYGRAHLLTEEPTEICDVDVFGCSYGGDIKACCNNAKKSDTSILVIHKEIVAHKLWAEQEGSIYARKFLEDNDMFDIILCGDCHQYFKFRSRKGERYIINCGPMFRDTAAEFSMEHEPGFFYHEFGKGLEWENIPHERASKVITRGHLEKKKEKKERFKEFFQKVKSGERLHSTFQQNLMDVVSELEANERVRNILVRVTDAEIKEQRKRIASTKGRSRK